MDYEIHCLINLSSSYKLGRYSVSNLTVYRNVRHLDQWPRNLPTALAGEGDVDIQEVGVHDLPIFLQEVRENLLISLSKISSGQNNDIINLKNWNPQI